MMLITSKTIERMSFCWSTVAFYVIPFINCFRICKYNFSFFQSPSYLFSIFRICSTIVFREITFYYGLTASLQRSIPRIQKVFILKGLFLTASMSKFPNKFVQMSCRISLMQGVKMVEPVFVNSWMNSWLAKLQVQKFSLRIPLGENKQLTNNLICVSFS